MTDLGIEGLNVQGIVQAAVKLPDWEPDLRSCEGTWKPGDRLMRFPTKNPDHMGPLYKQPFTRHRPRTRYPTAHATPQQTPNLDPIHGLARPGQQLLSPCLDNGAATTVHKFAFNRDVTFSAERLKAAVSRVAPALQTL